MQDAAHICEVWDKCADEAWVTAFIEEPEGV
jgi:hypothetical protein